MKLTANSNPIIPKKIANGINVKMATNIPPENNLYKNVAKIFIWNLTRVRIGGVLKMTI